ncbi:MAG: glycosyltransferase family 4 protein [Candidatus Lokiarchaeota archaeon]|nr:glycosyltransferase family 4 protein [Candidatus Lokiarchaeota archaeon]
MKIINFIGRKLYKINGILRRQLELDYYLSNKKNIEISYFYYLPPRNPVDFILKRFFQYPFQSYMNNKEKEIVNHIPAQFHSDLIHFLDKSKTVITCHDIFSFIEKNNVKNPLLLQKYLISGLRRCKYIIAISKFTKNELMRVLKIPEERIIVIKNGVNRKLFYPIEKNNRDKIEILYPNHKKLLHVGTEEDRKNFITLLKAFYYVKKKIKNIKLIRIGTPNYPSLIKNLGLEKDIVYISGISDIRLREIYNMCDILIFPSLYEGWGAPGLEAASCGTPVICSDIPVFKEIYKDFPIYFPPTDYKILNQCIVGTINNIEKRNQMSKKGISIAELYSWKRSANNYLDFIDSCF